MTLLFSTTFLFAQTSVDRGLTKERAIERRQYVRDVSYVNSFKFTDQGETFLGRTELKLKLNYIPNELSLDADFQEVSSIKINGKDCQAFQVRDHQILIAASALSLENKIEIEFVGTLFAASPGLVKYVDKKDGSVYLYSDNEPFNAFKMFPGFDQPDIKATFETLITAPKRWQLIGNVLEDKTTINGDVQVAHFPTTKVMSTYLYFVGGGDWVVWKDQWRNIPLRLMTRKSVAKNLDVKNIFQLTKRGFKFFTRYFKTDYAYAKYDQIFLPEWMWGGMENIGAVTLNEKYVYAATLDKKTLDVRAKTILHEMSHMWFGDLVTMKWWSDLWLNEAFARNMEEISFQALSHEKYDDVGFITDKQEPTYTDLTTDTHPVAQDMQCSHDADESFDDLTYEKGASVLQQLSLNIGKRKFKKSIRSYFKEYENSNTSYEDFVRVFSDVSNVDLNAWSESWLRHDGVSKMSVELVCKNDQVTSAKIIQNAINGGKFLKHISHYQTVLERRNDKLHLSSAKQVVIENEVTELTDLKGKKCPDLLILNTNGDDYAVQILNKAEVNWALKNITKLPALKPKLMLYYAVALNHNQKNISLDQFLEAAIKMIEIAQEDALIEELVSKGNPIFNAILALEADEKTEAVKKMKAVLLQKKNAVISSHLNMQFDRMITLLETSKLN